MYNLKGKTAFITGGAQGVGQGIATELAKAGDNIVIAQRSTRYTGETISKINALGREAMALQFDATNIESINKGIEKNHKQFPRIDIPVNNAGIVGQAAIAGQALNVDGGTKMN